MTVFGPWATASDVPEDINEAIKGRGCDPTAILGDLIGDMNCASFLGRPSAAAAGASVLGWQGSHMALVILPLALLWAIC